MVYIVKLFTVAINSVPLYAKVFVTVSHFLPNIINGLHFKGRLLALLAKLD